MYHCTCGAEIEDPSECWRCGEKFEDDEPEEDEDDDE